MVTHTSADLKTLPEIDRAKAAGLIDRAGMLVSAALPAAEFLEPGMADRFNHSEQRLLTAG